MASEGLTPIDVMGPVHSSQAACSTTDRRFYSKYVPVPASSCRLAGYAPIRWMVLVPRDRSFIQENSDHADFTAQCTPRFTFCKHLQRETFPANQILSIHEFFQVSNNSISSSPSLNRTSRTCNSRGSKDTGKERFPSPGVLSTRPQNAYPAQP